jgi:peptide-methionine (S)-S-oxide reductase
MAKAYFAAGCFWGIQQRFSRLDGVEKTAVGYMGGVTDSPDYKSVCTGKTGHAEVVEVEYDPKVIDFEALLSCFFGWHDPTQVNRQGPDIGNQYRTAIFPQTDEQWLKAREKITQLSKSGHFGQPIATSIERADKFWPAEDYHQDYLDKRGLGHFRIG